MAAAAAMMTEDAITKDTPKDSLVDLQDLSTGQTIHRRSSNITQVAALITTEVTILDIGPAEAKSDTEADITAGVVAEAVAGEEATTGVTGISITECYIPVIQTIDTTIE